MTDFKFPATLYKYRDWAKENDKKVLTNNELYFAPIDSFNDPFDVAIPTDFSLLNTQALKVKYAHDFLMGSSFFKQNNLDLKSEINRIVQLIGKDPDKSSEDFLKIEQSSYNRLYGVLSMSKIWNSILMWSHYSNNHQGFCIGFNGQKIITHKISRAGEVNYITDFPRISPLENDLDIIWKKWHNKYEKWIYEEEFRIIWASLDPNKELTKEDRILHFPNDYVKEVILGLNSDEQTKSEITSICKEKGWPLYQIIKVPWKYEIDREKIL